MTKSELNKLKAATKKLTKWESSGLAFGHFNVIDSVATNTDGADKIYEFYCLLRILDDLRHNYNITLIPGTPAGKIFPQAPSLKRGWPYFKIINKKSSGNKYQVCYGTKIKLSLAPLTTIAPDISIQDYNAGDDPDENEVELIMDAKFKYDNSHALPVNQIHDFMQRVNALSTQTAAALPIALNSLLNIKSNCLLTNGKALMDQKKYCSLYKILQVENFDIGKAHNVVG